LVAERRTQRLAANREAPAPGISRDGARRVDE
jgi:hypothetical protein